MTRANVSSLTQEHLLERFLSIALEQDQVETMDEPASRYNRLFQLMEEVESELKSRPGDGRHALIEFFEHENAHVRLKAALATLALVPDAAKETLRALSDRNIPPESMDARSLLRALEKGRYVPT